MKSIITIVFTSLLLIGCNQQNDKNIQYITKKFNEQIKKIDQVQYDVQNITEFSSGTVWDHKGFAILEKDITDSIFGFSFYGIRHDLQSAAIYKDGIGFDISKTDKTFEQDQGGLHFLGSPGGQMIYKDFFQLDSIYKTIEISVTDSSYVLKYSFEDDLENNITKKVKTVELSKTNFLPKRVSSSLMPDFGKKQTEEFIFTNIKINQEVTKITAFMKELNEYEQLIEEEPVPNPLLKKSLPQITLTDLFNENNLVTIHTEKITLIDFWEVWCGWCIKAFPDVEDIKNKYQDDLNVVGIVTQDAENARKLVQKKGATFTNLIGNQEINKLFSVNSWPRYFLVDKNGIIQEEYYGFSKQIEKDIQRLINE